MTAQLQRVERDEPADIRAALRHGSAALRGRSASARLDAEVLLARALDRPRAYLHAHPEERLGAAQLRRFRALVARRRRGMPVALLTGRREFWSLTLEVTADTLIPRPETETLVERALERIAPHAPLRIADLGTGSGAVALALARERPACRIVASDFSAAALAVAARNAASLGLAHVEFRRSDWCRDLGAEPFDLIVANPPYVRCDDPRLAAEELRHEPRAALAAGPSGTEALAEIARQARARLVAGGWLLLEHGCDQGSAAARLLADFGYRAVARYADGAGRPRVVAGRCPGPAGTAP